MKKIIILFLGLLLSTFSIAQTNQSGSIENDAIISGKFTLADKEVVVVEDMETGIVYKTNPINPGQFVIGESVKLHCDLDLKRGEVVKQGLNRKVFCHNKDWNAGFEFAIYLDGEDHVLLADNITEVPIENGTMVVLDGNIVNLPGKTSRVIDAWTSSGSGNDALEWKKYEGPPGDFVGSFDLGNGEVGIQCTGRGKCFKQAARKGAL